MRMIKEEQDLFLSEVDDICDQLEKLKGDYKPNQPIEKLIDECIAKLNEAQGLL
jgi:hypothetical protein